MKILYLLSLLLDLILLPIITLLSFIFMIGYYVKDVISGDIKILDYKFKDYFMHYIGFMKLVYIRGFSVHKYRILGL